MLIIREDSPIPKYIQLKEILYREIREGRVKEGEQLPPEASLAQRYGINRLTVRRAIKELIDEGLVERIHGKGTFVIGSESRIKTLLGSNTLNVGIGLYDVNYITTPSFSAVIAGAGQIIESHRYHLLLSTTNPEFNYTGDESFYRRMVSEKRIDGLIIMDQILPDEDILRLKKEKVPFILIDRTIPHQKVYSVRVNNKKGVYGAVEHLIRLRHRKIAFVSANLKFYVELEKLEGYRLALRENGLEYDEHLVKDASHYPHPHKYHQIVQELIQLPNPPTAIFATGDSIAYEILGVLKERGFNLPEEMALVGYDDALPNILIEPPLTSVKVPYYKLGKIAAEMLFKLLKKEKVRNREIIIEPQLVVRSSCGKKQPQVLSKNK